jgi:glycerophosphoryl diester phosphodiesterase
MKINPALAFKKIRLPYPHRGIIGHRGLSSKAPENTRASFMAAAAAGLSWVEFDIQRCASGEWVVFHDETVERTSNGRGAIREKSVTELKSLDIGSWFDPRFSDERILSLAEVLPLLSRLGLHPNIEVKFFETDAPIDAMRMAAQIGPVIQRYWIHHTDRPALVSSFHLDFLKAFRQLYADWPIGYLVETFEKQSLNIVQAAHFSTLNSSKESLLTYFERSTLMSQIPLLAFTVNDTPTAERLFSAGISAIFSDKADLFR